MRSLLIDGGLDLAWLGSLREAPELFLPGEPAFWDDPHISRQMLKAHLDPETDAASYRPERIARTVAWLVESLGLTEAARVLDLGCGPGLYASRLARLGIAVTGIDLSPNSIEYAREYSRLNELDIDYRCENYLVMTEEENAYELALLISGDYCALAPQQREQLLYKVHRSLVPGGRFVLDVTTETLRYRVRGPRWYVSEGGFWRAGLHLVLEQGFDYAPEKVHLDQYIVIEGAGRSAVYRNWLQAFDLSSLPAELAKGGFQVESVGSDLTGSPLRPGSDWLGVVARKAP